MSKPICFIYVEDLDFREKLREVVLTLDINEYFLTRGDQIYQLVKNWVPFMLVVDLTGPESEWIFKHIAMIESSVPDFPILAIVPDNQEHARQRAESYGCGIILTKKEFAKKIHAQIERVLRKKLQ